MTATTPSRLRELKKESLRSRILDGFMALLLKGAGDLSHHAVAKCAAVSRRTVYRYFPDRESLMDAALDRVRSLAGPRVTYPRSVEDILGTLEPIYTGFDRIAPFAIMLRSTPQGRALRLSQNRRRIDNYTAALANAVNALPKDDRRLATAMIQVLHTTPWLEMHDHWRLNGRQIARATAWAIRTLLADLKMRGSAPLDRELCAPADAPKTGTAHLSSGPKASGTGGLGRAFRERERVMTTKSYDRCFNAILQKKRLTFAYEGEPREVCPHMLGRTDGKEKLFAYQVKGGSRQGELPPGGGWRCFFVSKITAIQMKEGPWKTGDKHRQRHSCVRDVEIDVNPSAKQKFSWEEYVRESTRQTAHIVISRQRAGSANSKH